MSSILELAGEDETLFTGAATVGDELIGEDVAGIVDAGDGEEGGDDATGGVGVVVEGRTIDDVNMGLMPHFLREEQGKNAEEEHTSNHITNNFII
jgi:hypothetical protein